MEVNGCLWTDKLCYVRKRSLHCVSHAGKCVIIPLYEEVKIEPIIRLEKE